MCALILISTKDRGSVLGLAKGNPGLLHWLIIAIW